MVTVNDILKFLSPPDRVRILQGDEEIFNDYLGNLTMHKELVEQIGGLEVKKYKPYPEITHRQWRERGLIAPLKPDETPDYSFSDLQLCIYYTITI